MQIFTVHYGASTWIPLYFENPINFFGFSQKIQCAVVLGDGVCYTPLSWLGNKSSPAYHFVGLRVGAPGEVLGLVVTENVRAVTEEINVHHAVGSKVKKEETVHTTLIRDIGLQYNIGRDRHPSCCEVRSKIGRFMKRGGGGISA